MLSYLCSLLALYGAAGAYHALQSDLSDGDTLATLSSQGKARAMAALIGFASRD